MKSEQKIIKKNDKYFLNDYQFFYVNQNLKKDIEEIKFPAIIMDTEFFNNSHDRERIKPKLYDDNINKDLIYIIQYSFAKNFKEIVNRKNNKAIKSLTIKRRINDSKYSFFKQYKLMMKSFINMCINKGIKTLIFAGDANDKIIITKLINQNKALLKNKKSDVFTLNENTGEYEVNTFDVYPLLTKNLAVSNFNQDGDEFLVAKNHKKGFKGEKTLALPSLKKVFEYFQSLYQKGKFGEEDDIYELCISALKFFSKNEFKENEFKNLANDVKKAKHHCYNDVLRLLYMIKFAYLFSINDSNNNYLVEEKKG